MRAGHDRVAGEDVSQFAPHIKRALTGYSALTGNIVSFENERASRLESVEGQAMARSESVVSLRGNAVAKLVVLAFAPGDGTGKDIDHTAKELDMGGFPEESRYVPSRKPAHGELHLGLAAKMPDRRIVRYANHLGLLGVIPAFEGASRVTELGYVGHEPHMFGVALLQNAHRGIDLPPRATLTAGELRPLSPFARHIETFGNPHAVANLVEDSLQIAGFIALSGDDPRLRRLPELLGAEVFRPYPQL